MISFLCIKKYFKKYKNIRNNAKYRIGEEEEKTKSNSVIFFVFINTKQLPMHHKVSHRTKS